MKKIVLSIVTSVTLLLVTHTNAKSTPVTAPTAFAEAYRFVSNDYFMKISHEEFYLAMYDMANLNENSKYWNPEVHISIIQNYYLKHTAKLTADGRALTADEFKTEILDKRRLGFKKADGSFANYYIMSIPKNGSAAGYGKRDPYNTNEEVVYLLSEDFQTGVPFASKDCLNPLYQPSTPSTPPTTRKVQPTENVQWVVENNNTFTPASTTPQPVSVNVTVQNQIPANMGMGNQQFITNQRVKTKPNAVEWLTLGVATVGTGFAIANNIKLNKIENMLSRQSPIFDNTFPPNNGGYDFQGPSGAGGSGYIPFDPSAANGRSNRYDENRLVNIRSGNGTSGGQSNGNYNNGFVVRGL